MSKRDNLMLKLEDMKLHLYHNRPEESLESFKDALSSYAVPEIYSRFDVELVHFFIYLDENLPIHKRCEISKKIKDLIENFKNTRHTVVPAWLLDLISLTLAGFSPSEDPRDIKSIRNLINMYPDSMELKLFLALALIQDSIDTDNEKGFKESLKIFKNLYSLFSKKAERANRFRLYFPENPEQLFNRLRIWATLQYSEYLQIHDRDQEAIQLLNSQMEEPWYRSACESDRTNVRIEVKLIQRLQEMRKINKSQYKTNNKSWLSAQIGVFFSVPMMGALLASSHLGYQELAKLIVIILLSTILIIRVALLSLGHEKKLMNYLLFFLLILVMAFLVYY